MTFVKICDHGGTGASLTFDRTTIDFDNLDALGDALTEALHQQVTLSLQAAHDEEHEVGPVDRSVFALAGPPYRCGRWADIHPGDAVAMPGQWGGFRTVERVAHADWLGLIPAVFDTGYLVRFHPDEPVRIRPNGSTT